MLFMLMGWECLWTAATIEPIVHPSGDILAWRAMVEWYWQGKAKNSEKICPSATLSTTNLTWTDLGMNPSICNEKLVAKCLSDGVANK
jgi:hypothetical protein